MTCSYWALLAVAQESGTRTLFTIPGKGFPHADYLLALLPMCKMSAIRIKASQSSRSVREGTLPSPSIPQQPNRPALRIKGLLSLFRSEPGTSQ